MKPHSSCSGFAAINTESANIYGTEIRKMTTSDEDYLTHLALKLKQLGNVDGNEKDTEEHVAEVTKVLHNFGLHYRKQSPDKIKLIQSAAFINAALVRQPNNQILIADLKELCSHVLEIANAKKTDADLIEISCTVKSMMEDLRKFRNEEMKSIEQDGFSGLDFYQLFDTHEKVQKIEKLSSEVSKRYNEIVTYISDQCEQIMGQSPCNFTISGTGDLVDKGTSSGKFKHIVILEEGAHKQENYPEIQQHFQWFSTIFQIIITNLRETQLDIKFVTIKRKSD